MNRVPVQSSNIVEVGYDARTQTLEIMFRDGGLYQYFDVPDQIFQELRGAGSPGQYFHGVIKGNYRYARL